MSAMWMGRVERLLPPLLRSASRSIELMSPRISRRLASSRSRKCSRSLGENPAWFLRGFSLLATGGNGVVCPERGSSPEARAGTRFPLSEAERGLDLPAGSDFGIRRLATAFEADFAGLGLAAGLALRADLDPEATFFDGAFATT